MQVTPQIRTIVTDQASLDKGFRRVLKRLGSFAMIAIGQAKLRISPFDRKWMVNEPSLPVAGRLVVMD